MVVRLRYRSDEPEILTEFWHMNCSVPKISFQFWPKKFRRFFKQILIKNARNKNNVTVLLCVISTCRPSLSWNDRVQHKCC